MKNSLTTNALALMVATVVTNAVGLIFWAVAAKLKDPHEVGHAAAVVAGATLLATISQLNLTNVFLRLVPTAGRLARPFVIKGYVAVCAFAVVLAVFYWGTGLSGHLISSSWPARLGFTVTVALLAIFALQDSVLTSLRLAPWVMIENVSFSITKLALVPAFALLLGASGIVIAWIIPAAVATVVISWLLHHRVFPGREDQDGELPERSKILNFVAAEYLSNCFSTATTQVMPLLIVWKLGEADAAYFTIPWLIGLGITFLMWNVASSFIVEFAEGRADTKVLARRSGVLLAVIIGGSLIVCVAAAHPLLEILGARYARHGATLLRLLGLTQPFYAVVAVYSTLAWVDQRVWTLAGLTALSGVLMVGVTLLLIPRAGVAAPGWAYLGTEVILAAVAAPLIGARFRRGPLLSAV
jgi:O-antigen/teichoic acid export membrane protein